MVSCFCSEEENGCTSPRGGGDTSHLSQGGGGVTTTSQEGAQTKEGQTTSHQGVSIHALKVKLVLWLENVYKKNFLKLHVVSPFLVPSKRGGKRNGFKVGISPLVSY